MSVDAVAAAVSDPVRRAILDTLADRPLAANDIAAQFTISRPAVSRHLRVLRESGLVTSTADGRQRLYTLDARPLAALVTWALSLQSRSDWDTRFDALDTEVRRAGRDRRASRSAHRSSTRKESA